MKRNNWIGCAAVAALAFAGTLGCNEERQRECGQFALSLKALDETQPGVESVGRARDAIGATQFQDEPLREYAKNTKATLTVLANTLELRSNPDAPDGTESVIKQKLKEARTERADVARYCAQ